MASIAQTKVIKSNIVTKFAQTSVHLIRLLVLKWSDIKTNWSENFRCQTVIISSASRVKCNIWHAKKLSCKKVWPSKVESYLKDEWMHGIANNKRWYLNAAKIRSYIIIYYIIIIAIKIGYILLSSWYL